MDAQESRGRAFAAQEGYRVGVPDAGKRLIFDVVLLDNATALLAEAEALEDQVHCDGRTIDGGMRTGVKVIHPAIAQAERHRTAADRILRLPPPAGNRTARVQRPRRHAGPPLGTTLTRPPQPRTDGHPVAPPCPTPEAERGFSRIWHSLLPVLPASSHRHHWLDVRKAGLLDRLACLACGYSVG
ncbi:hypothetical protein [Kitasatospora sp. NPDC088783]|uniref:hypothetical protein n=1 Tax=Kitasatospora sp. NPDC088783 TaxID=3364077 RepID=UPI003815878F